MRRIWLLLIIMLSQAIILTGSREAPTLTELLKRHNAQLTVRHAESEAELLKHMAATGYAARLIAFTTGVIVKQDLLDKLKLKPYNFHPGPPTYPGRYPEAWGIYQEARWFGSTAHQMVRLVDEGPIVDIDMFEVPAGADRFDMAKLCYGSVTRLFQWLSPVLATSTEDLPLREDLQWSGRKWRLADYEDLRDHPPADDEVERLRRFNSFGPPSAR